MPGQWDCALFVASWVDRLTGTERYRHLRGSYATHFGGLKKLAPLGICHAVGSTLRATGWTETTDPIPGAIVLTDIDHPGIWTGERIVSAARGAAGHTFLHARHAKSFLNPPA